MLAKAYLWLKAAELRGEEIAGHANVAPLLAQVRAEMPETWVESLDAKVAEHLASLKPQG